MNVTTEMSAEQKPLAIHSRPLTVKPAACTEGARGGMRGGIGGEAVWASERDESLGGEGVKPYGRRRGPRQSCPERVGARGGCSL